MSCRDVCNLFMSKVCFEAIAYQWRARNYAWMEQRIRTNLQHQVLPQHSKERQSMSEAWHLVRVVETCIPQLSIRFSASSPTKCFIPRPCSEDAEDAGIWTHVCACSFYGTETILLRQWRRRSCGPVKSLMMSPNLTLTVIEICR